MQQSTIIYYRKTLIPNLDPMVHNKPQSWPHSTLSPDPITETYNPILQKVVLLQHSLLFLYQGIKKLHINSHQSHVMPKTAIQDSHYEVRLLSFTRGIIWQNQEIHMKTMPNLKWYEQQWLDWIIEFWQSQALGPEQQWMAPLIKTLVCVPLLVKAILSNWYHCHEVATQ